MAIDGIFLTLFYLALIGFGLTIAAPIAALVQHFLDKRQRPMARKRR